MKFIRIGKILLNPNNINFISDSTEQKIRVFYEFGNSN